MMRLSVVIPARNESDNIGVAIESVMRVMTSAHCAYEIIVVDDGSSDGTASLARQYQENAPVTVLINPNGPGKGSAIKFGFQWAKGELVAFLDADLEFPVEALPSMERIIADGGDPDVAVIAARTEDRRSLVERVTSRMSHWVIRTILGMPYRDTQAGLKMFPGWFARTVLVPLAQEDGWMFDPEALMLASRHGVRVVELAVTQQRKRPRRARATEFVASGFQAARLARRYRFVKVNSVAVQRRGLADPSQETSEAEA